MPINGDFAVAIATLVASIIAGIFGFFGSVVAAKINANTDSARSIPETNEKPRILLPEGVIITKTKREQTRISIRVQRLTKLPLLFAVVGGVAGFVFSNSFYRDPSLPNLAMTATYISHQPVSTQKAFATEIGLIMEPVQAVATSLAQQQSTPLPVMNVRQVALLDLAVREGPSDNAQMVWFLPQGTSVLVQSEQGIDGETWYFIEAPDLGLFGWVRAKYLHAP